MASKLSKKKLRLEEEQESPEQSPPMKEKANQDLKMLKDEKFNSKISKKYAVNTNYFSPMNSTQLTGVPSWGKPPAPPAVIKGAAVETKPFILNISP